MSATIISTKNLGLIKAIYVGTSAPINIKMIWYDDNIGVKKHKYYDVISSTWIFLSNNVSGGGLPLAGAGLIYSGDNQTLNIDFNKVPSIRNLYDIPDWQNSVLNIVSTPPSTPSTGDRYLISTTPTGIFSGEANNIATWLGTAWVYTAPRQGMRLNNIATNNTVYLFDSTNNWVPDPGASGSGSSEWADSVISVLNTPPSTPSTGDRYLIGITPTGVWSTNKDKVAQWTGSQWKYTTPTEGYTIRIDSYNGGEDVEFVYHGVYSTGAYEIQGEYISIHGTRTGFPVQGDIKFKQNFSLAGLDSSFVLFSRIYPSYSSIGKIVQGTAPYIYAYGFAENDNDFFPPERKLSVFSDYSSCYYDSTLAHVSDSDKALPKTTSQMKTAATFIGWDFTNVWIQDNSINSGYPQLRMSALPSNTSLLPISTVADWKAAFCNGTRQNSDKSYYLTNDIDFVGVTDYCSNVFMPVCLDNIILDGRGFKVKNLVLNNYAFSGRTIGGTIFRAMDNTTIKNILFENVSGVAAPNDTLGAIFAIDLQICTFIQVGVTGTYTVSNQPNNRAAGFTIDAGNNTYTDCYSIVNFLTPSSYTGTSEIAGFSVIGVNDVASGISHFTRCYSAATIPVLGTASIVDNPIVTSYFNFGRALLTKIIGIWDIIVDRINIRGDVQINGRASYPTSPLPNIKDNELVPWGMVKTAVNEVGNSLTDDYIPKSDISTDSTLGGSGASDSLLPSQKAVHDFLTGVQFIYVGYADQADGTGYTASQDGTKKYIAFKQSNVPLTPVQATFNGIWARYFGDVAINATTTLPANSSGVNGDITFVNGKVYKKIAGIWTYTGVNVTGAAGKDATFSGGIYGSTIDLDITGVTNVNLVGGQSEIFGIVNITGGDGATEDIRTFDNFPDNPTYKEVELRFSGNTTFNVFGGANPGEIIIPGDPNSTLPLVFKGGNDFARFRKQGDQFLLIQYGSFKSDSLSTKYVYIGYADDLSGTNYSPTDASKNFIATITTENPLSPPTQDDFTGQWYDRSGGGSPYVPPYKSYVAIITQSGTTAPVVQRVLHNDLPWGIGYHYVGVGDYIAYPQVVDPSYGSAGNVFPDPSKVTSEISSSGNFSRQIVAFIDIDDSIGGTVTIYSFILAQSPQVLQDDGINQCKIEIRVYS